jgi:hypothetical protein
MRLTERDIALLLDVYKYRYLSSSQIKELHFPSKDMAYRRLRALLEMSFLKSFTVPNILERMYYLDKKGAEVIAIELQVDTDNLTWHRHTKQPKDYYFLKHFMAINDFRILITQACGTSSISLLGFIPEYIGDKTPEGYVKKYIRDRVNNISSVERVSYSHTPDAVFALEKDGKSALFFLEIDRGIEAVTDREHGFLKCIFFYLNYWTEKAFTRYNDDFKHEFSTFRMLVTTPSQTRLQHMREAVTQLQFPNELVKRFFWGSVNSWVRKDTVFEPIWQSLDITDGKAYRIG